MPLDPQPGRTNILQLVIGLVFLVPGALCVLYGSVYLLAAASYDDRQSQGLLVAVSLFFLVPGMVPTALGAWLTYTAFPRRESFVSATAEGPPRWSPLRILMFGFGLLWLLPAAFRLAHPPFMTTLPLPLGGSTSQVSNAVTMALGGALMYAALKLHRRA